MNDATLEANLGLMVFTSGDKSFCAEWIAAGPRLVPMIRQYTDQETQSLILNSADGETVEVSSLTSRHLIKSVAVKIPALGNRYRDSEFLLINFLESQLANNPVPSKGRLSLVTERMPCVSCTGILKVFVRAIRGYVLTSFFFTIAPSARPGILSLRCRALMYRFVK